MEWLKLLQPGKKWTEKKERYWFYDAEPIRGILAQMIGSCVRTTASAIKRRRILCKKLGLTSIEVNPELTDDGEGFDARVFENEIYANIVRFCSAPAMRYFTRYRCEASLTHGLLETVRVGTGSASF